MLDAQARTLTLFDYDLEVRTTGSGSPLVLLPGEQGTIFSVDFVAALAEQHTVHMPSHPGWGDSKRTDRFRTVADIASLYLDLLDTFDEPVPVVGVSFGGWIAAELASMTCERISRLALVAPLGLRSPLAVPTDRTFLDVYAAAPAEVSDAMYGTGPRPDLGTASDAVFLELARSDESFAYYGWQPYLYSETLAYRLHRISVPTLVAVGEQDGLLLDPDYAASFAGSLGVTSTPVVLPAAGHRVEEQYPRELADLILRHIAG